jgi:hypothetical protein
VKGWGKFAPLTPHSEIMFKFKAWKYGNDLSDIDIKVYLMYFSLCYKGSRIRCYREIKVMGVGKSLGLSYTQVRHSLKKIIKLGLLEKITTTFQREQGTVKLWTMASYFRIPSDDKKHPL